MMTTFILDVLTDLHQKQTPLSETTFILPSRRAGLFLKHQLHKFSNIPILAPEILSIEEFVEALSQIKKISSTELLFLFYDSYLKLTPESESESFESFSKWGPHLLQDFNEIDRHLVSQEKIFNYLSAIKEIEQHHWSLDEPQTEFIKKYLSFWNKLHTYYSHFSNALLEKKTGYQGLVYREAVNNIESYIQNHPNKYHVFLGFNALNAAEETIIQELLENDLASIYWDIDAVFLENTIHDAGLFIRGYKKQWPYFRRHDFNWVSTFYSTPKNIAVFGVPKQVGQAKYIGTLLEDINRKKGSLENTAVVLGDENLLTPLLNSLPKELDAVNITMGLPLKSVPLASLFKSLFEIHKKQASAFYFKDVIKLVSHQFIRPLFLKKDIDYSTIILNSINRNNLVYLTMSQLKGMTEDCDAVLDMLFSGWQGPIHGIIENCRRLILLLKTHLDQDKSANLLALEYLFRFNTLFNELHRLNETYHHIKDISTLYGLYKELLNLETLDFHGEPLQGLQIMGMLESRVLDFETVIIASVNEGLLPSGKTTHSFIPFDVKLENNLPTYKEKDAVYTYHFYRLLQRAKNICLLYNTEADALNSGEKSRFITQMEIEGIHELSHNIVAPKVPIIQPSLIKIQKTDTVINTLKSVAEKGFSPSSLTNYIRNPLDFYQEKILGIKDLEDVEETIAFNTLGTVVHNTLEDFYKPFVGEYLSVGSIKALKPQIAERVRYHFKQVYREGDIRKGKNLIIYEITKRYIYNFLNFEIKELESGHRIKIRAVEANNHIPIEIPEINFQVHLRGKVDRVDEYNGMTRIIDYKTGNVLQNHLDVVNWEDLTTDYTKYSKSFQVLTYAYMMHKSNQIDLPVEAGILSFKNLSSGIIKFSKKDKNGRGSKKVTLITEHTLAAFENELKKIIIEICNPDIDFIEKDI